MPRILAAGFILLSICASAFAQPADGTVISREALSVPDDAPDRVKAAAAKVTLERVIYVSDGLEVEGYVARPRETCLRSLAPPIRLRSRWHVIPASLL